MSEEEAKQEDIQQEPAQEQVKTFTEQEVKDLIAEAIETEVSGLKNKRDELLGKLKEKDNAIESERLKREGTVEERELFWQTQMNDLKTKHAEDIEKRDSAIKERDKNEIISKLSGELVDSEVGAFLLKQMVDVEDGKPIFRDHNKQIVADNLNDFKEWMSTNPHMSHFVRGTQATGGGASGGASKVSDGNTITREQWASMTTEQKAKAAANPKFQFAD